MDGYSTFVFVACVRVYTRKVFMVPRTRMKSLPVSWPHDDVSTLFNTTLFSKHTHRCCFRTRAQFRPLPSVPCNTPAVRAVGHQRSGQFRSDSLIFFLPNLGDKKCDPSLQITLSFATTLYRKKNGGNRHLVRGSGSLTRKVRANRHRKNTHFVLWMNPPLRCTKIKWNTAIFLRVNFQLVTTIAMCAT